MTNTRIKGLVEVVETLRVSLSLDRSRSLFVFRLSRERHLNTVIIISPELPQTTRMWGFAGGGMAGAYGAPRRFEEQYHCYSVAYADKAHLEVREKTLGFSDVAAPRRRQQTCNDKPFLTPSVS